MAAESHICAGSTNRDQCALARLLSRCVQRTEQTPPQQQTPWCSKYLRLRWHTDKALYYRDTPTRSDFIRLTPDDLVAKLAFFCTALLNWLLRGRAAIAGKLIFIICVERRIKIHAVGGASFDEPVCSVIWSIQVLWCTYVAPRIIKWGNDTVVQCNFLSPITPNGD